MPELTDFATGGLPNIDSTYLPLACLIALQQDNRPIVEGLLATGPGPSPVLAWHWTKDELVPAWAVCKQGSRYLIIVRGTTNAAQWFHHLRGALGRQYDLPGKALVHRFFHSVEQQLYEATRAVLPADLGGITLHIVGHSFGAGLAFLLSNRYRENFPDLEVQVMTWGEPRSLSNLYEGRLAQVHVRYANQGDLVCEVPPGSITVVDVVAPFNRALTWMNRGVKVGQYVEDVVEQWGPRKWKHYAPGQRVRGDGTVTPFRETTGLEQLGLLIPTPTLWYNTHLADTGYGQVFVKVYERRGSPPGHKATMAALVGLISSGAQPLLEAKFRDPTAEEAAEIEKLLGWQTGGPPASALRSPTSVLSSARVLYPAPSESNGGFFLGSASMASGIWDVTTVVSNDAYSKTQTFGLTAGDLVSATIAAKDLASKRANLLGRNVLTSPSGVNAQPGGRGTPCVEFLRIVDAKDPRYGQVLNVPRENGNPSKAGPTDGGADPLWTDLTFPLYGTASGQRRRHQVKIVGIPDAVIKAGSYDGTYAFGFNAPLEFNARLKDFILFLCNTGGNWGITGQDPATPVRDINSWLVNADGELQATSAVAHGYVTDDRVRISGTGSRYANRIWYVRAIDATTFALKKSRRADDQEPPLGGKARLWATKAGQRQVVLYRFDAIENPSTFDPSALLTVSRTKPGKRIVRTSFGRRGKLNS